MIRLGLLTALGVTLLDQLSKWFALGLITDPPRLLEITPFLNFGLVMNRGVSFGLLGSDNGYAPYLLILLSLVIMGGIIYWLASVESRRLAIAAGFILGGAAGNVIDRVRYGAVVDFIDMHLGGYHWWTYNLADAAISCAAAFILYLSLFSKTDGLN